MQSATRDELMSFLDDALKKYIELEREARDAHRRAAVLEGGEEEERRVFTAWVVGQDEAHNTGVRAALTERGCVVGATMTAGGEVLDRLSGEIPDIVILIGTLPDIPAEFVLDGLHGDHPQVARVVVEIGDDGSQLARLLGPFEATEVRRRLTDANDFLDIMRHAEERMADLAMGREAAARFRDRHDAFLRRFVAVRRRLAAEPVSE